jgi:hypothetical protein
MPADCTLCRAEGWSAQSRILVELRGRSVIATLNVLTGGGLHHGEAGLSDIAWKTLRAQEGAAALLRTSPVVPSMSDVRSKLYGGRWSPDACVRIVRDIAAERYSALEIAAFVATGAGDHLDLEETIALTRAMLDVGERLGWDRTPVMDKHCIGGLPGNRTTLLVVPIIAAAGLLIPKTSSRAITSPAGTADAMETLAPVALDTRAMRGVVERCGGCVVWGGAVGLSPVDALIIPIERPLDLDSTGQMVASVLSKKKASGATHVLIDIPVGPTAKMRTTEAATKLARRLRFAGTDLDVLPVLTDGSGPVGSGIRQRTGGDDPWIRPFGRAVERAQPQRRWLECRLRRHDSHVDRDERHRDHRADAHATDECTPAEGDACRVDHASVQRQPIRDGHEDPVGDGGNRRRQQYQRRRLCQPRAIVMAGAAAESPAVAETDRARPLGAMRIHPRPSCRDPSDPCANGVAATNEAKIRWRSPRSVRANVTAPTTASR